MMFHKMQLHRFNPFNVQREFIYLFFFPSARDVEMLAGTFTNSGLPDSPPIDLLPGVLTRQEIHHNTSFHILISPACSFTSAFIAD